MILNKTVLILGAGASMPYGFPSGEELAKQLARPANASSDQNAFASVDITVDDANYFASEFRASGNPSIDEFLHHRPDLARVGKIAIALKLIQNEHSENLANPIEGYGHWYQHLWSQMRGTWETFEQNQLRIITFNYDRSLEFFLAQGLSKTFQKSLIQGIDKLECLRIKHVYGQLAPLVAAQGDEYGRPYSQVVNARTLVQAANGIKLMQEREPDEVFVRAIVEDISWADRICFLGFSFNEANLKVLAPEVLASRKEGFVEGSTSMPLNRFGTTKELKAYERIKAIRLTGSFNHSAQFLDCDSLHLLRELGVLQT